MKKNALIICLLLILVLLGSGFYSSTPASSSRSIQAYFSPEGGAEKAILKAIRSSRKEVLVAIYMFTSRPISGALLQAKHRGVKISVLMDGREKNASYSQASTLKRKGVDLHFVWPKSSSRDSRTGKFHQKYIVIDRKVVITGSFNYTRAADQINHENIVIITSKSLAKAYRNNFIKVYKNKKITRK